mmetsp:Transcript_9279/g.16374  ORF Transcript_9279/g.16374 Transcript_9279/m.16374 type:complete len:233 (-) Transcript_9279:760-1458(-)|eukprot:CAMPEP_0119101870 /NCGR_PEP_ID=MMETSP1180-20130426/794_1 /TAXON_ID=3052 ORGANISM="Chlamydomonas cf sp, Strain CCMP681" /NCGR_SAMPLE_ID=MMETSP1180 /ASSEMBLY_ACC=CAM_ASM_000741 /LENGTH=232 /DNA_ID=CAMNT_0007086051 /DNA_START=56 /DNA_END=754 /DNA_ORIENTATION=+
MMDTLPRDVCGIHADYLGRRSGLLRALTEEADKLYEKCDPKLDNLCLYGQPNGQWLVGPPAEEVPPELPEPCLGINFARDGMSRTDWLSLVAVHCDTWLLSVAFYFGVKLDSTSRQDLFHLINQQATLFEVVAERRPSSMFPGRTMGKRPRMERPHESLESSGKPLAEQDISPLLQGRQAELYWPDDKKWYLVSIQSLNTKSRQAKILYASGEFEEVNINDILNDGHMCLLD